MKENTYCRLNPKTNRLEMTVVLDLPEGVRSKNELIEIMYGNDGTTISGPVRNIVEQAWSHIERFRALKPEQK